MYPGTPPSSRSNRAQRLTASKERSPELQQQLQPLYSVLNALRHQRNDRIPVFSNVGEPVCSTPYGIKGTIAAVAEMVKAVLNECSTPYGIKGTIAPIGTACISGGDWCSTPYGIKGTIA